MDDHITLQTVGVIVGWIVLAVGVAVGYGRLKEQVTKHEKAISECDKSELMTVDKCQNFHDVAMKATEVTLKNIQDSLAEIKKDRRLIDSRLGQLTSNLEVFMDRVNRGSNGE